MNLSNNIPRLVGVIGAGTMGLGITELFAAKKIPVVLTDTSQDVLDSALSRLKTSLTKHAGKGRIEANDVEAALGRIRVEKGLTGLSEVDLVVEAVAEIESVKRQVFRECDEVVPRHAVLASNTSSISLTRIAAVTSRPEQVVGLHFMNPPIAMSLIEIVRGMCTADATFQSAEMFAKHLGKVTVMSHDRPGFIVNRILMPMINEAFFTLMEGVASARDIDAGMQYGTGHPMGPLTLADFIGLDVVLAVCKVLHEGLGEDKYRPCPLLVQYVDAGWLGRKSGRGIFQYRRSTPS